MVLSHDERIVEMRFDNENFERNVQTTLGTIDRLKARLGLLDTTSVGLEVDNRALNSIDHISTSVDKISGRFNALGIVGKRVLENLADTAYDTAKIMASTTFGQIKTGGSSRALNIEQAQYLMKGLGIEWKKAYEDIDHAVSGTAYGLDKAAMAAANLSASGIELGTDMKEALGAISGMAAVTGQEYESIADIFTAVAARGKVMASELNRIRGVNVRALLAEEYGVSQGELVELMADKKLEIDPQTFFRVIYDKFFETAKEANSTYKGAKENLESALSRIGELYYRGIHNEDKGLDMGGYFESQRRIYNALRLAINEVKGFIEDSSIMHKLLERLDKKASLIERIFSDTVSTDDPLQGIGMDAIRVVAEAVETIAQNLFRVSDKIGEAWNKIFPGSIGDRARALIDSLDDFADQFWITDEVIDKVGKNAESAFSMLKAFFNILGKGLEFAKPVAKTLGNIFGVVLDFFGYLAKLYNGDDINKGLEDTGTNFGWVGENLKNAAWHLADWTEKARIAIRDGNAFALVALNLANGFNFFADILKRAKDRFLEFFNEGEKVTFEDFTLEGFFDFLTRFVDGVIDLIAHSAGRIWDAFKPMRDMFSNAFDMLFKDANPQNIKELGKLGIFAFLAYRVGQILGYIKSWTGLIPPAINSLLFSIGRSMRYRAYAMMAVAGVASVVLAIIALGNMDEGALERGIDAISRLAKLTAVIVGVFYILSMIMAWRMMAANAGKKIFDKDRSKGPDTLMYSIAATFAAMGVAFGIMAKAVHTMGNMSGTEIGKGFLGLLGMMVVIAGGIITIGKFGKNLGDTWKSILALAAVFYALSIVMKNIARIAESDYIYEAYLFMVLFVGIFAIAAGMMMLAKDANWKPLLAIGFAFNSISKVAKSLEKISRLSEDQLERGVSVLVLLYGMLAFLAALSSRMGPVGAGFGGIGIAFLMLALSIDVLVPALYALTKIDLVALIQRTMVIMGLMVALSRSSLLAGDPKSILSGGAAMMLMAIAIDLLTIPLIALAAVPIERLALAAAVIVVVGYVFASMAFLSGQSMGLNPLQMIAVAGAMAIMALAMDLLIPAVMAFAAIPGERLAQAAIAIVGIIIAITAAFAIISVVSQKFPLTVPIILAVAGAFVIMSIGMIGVSVAIGIFAVSLGILFSVFTHFEDSIGTIMKFIGVIGTLGIVLISVGAGLAFFAVGLAALAIALIGISAAGLIFSAAMFIGALGLAAVVEAMVLFAEHADVIKEKATILSNLTEVLIGFSKAMIFLGIGGAVLGFGLVVFGNGAIIAASGISAVGFALDGFSSGFEKFAIRINNSAQIIINSFAMIIDYALVAAQAIASVGGKGDNSAYAEIKSLRQELRENTKQTTNLFGAASVKTGTTTKNGFSRKSGKFKKNTEVTDDTAVVSKSVAEATKKTAKQSGLENLIPNGIAGTDPKAIQDSIMDVFGDIPTDMDIPGMSGFLENNLGSAFDMDISKYTESLDALQNMPDTSDIFNPEKMFSGIETGLDTVNADEMYDSILGDLDTMIPVNADDMGAQFSDNFLKGIKQEASSVFPGGAESVWNELKGEWEGFVQVDADKMGGDVVTGIADGLRNASGELEGATDDMATTIYNRFNEHANKFQENGENVGWSYANSLYTPKIRKAVSKQGKNLYNTLDASYRNVARIASPSKKAEWLGKMTVAGLNTGAVKEADRTDGQKIGDKVFGGLKDYAQRLINPDIDWNRAMLASGLAESKFASMSRSDILKMTDEDIKEYSDLVAKTMRHWSDNKIDPFSITKLGAGWKSTMYSTAYGELGPALNSILRKGKTGFNIGRIFESATDDTAMVAKHIGKILASDGEINYDLDSGAFWNKDLKGASDRDLRILKTIKKAKDTISESLSFASLDNGISMRSAGEEITNGLAEGIASKKAHKKLTDEAEQLYRTVDNAYRRIAKIQSPAKKMVELGELTFDGLIEGFKRKRDEVRQELENGLSQELRLKDSLTEDEYQKYLEDYHKTAADLTAHNNWPIVPNDENGAFQIYKVLRDIPKKLDDVFFVDTYDYDVDAAAMEERKKRQEEKDSELWYLKNIIKYSNNEDAIGKAITSYMDQKFTDTESGEKYFTPFMTTFLGFQQRPDHLGLTREDLELIYGAVQKIKPFESDAEAASTLRDAELKVLKDQLKNDSFYVEYPFHADRYWKRFLQNDPAGLQEFYSFPKNHKDVMSSDPRIVRNYFEQFIASGGKAYGGTHLLSPDEMRAVLDEAYMKPLLTISGGVNALVNGIKYGKQMRDYEKKRYEQELANAEEFSKKYFNMSFDELVNYESGYKDFAEFMDVHYGKAKVGEDPDIVWSKEVSDYIDMIKGIYSLDANPHLEKEKTLSIYDMRYGPSIAKYDDKTALEETREAHRLKLLRDAIVMGDWSRISDLGGTIAESVSTKVEDTIEPVLYGSVRSSHTTRFKARPKVVTNNGKGVLSPTPTNTATAIRSSEAANAAEKAAKDTYNANMSKTISQMAGFMDQNNIILGRTNGLLSKDKAVYIDGNKLVGAVTEKMDRSLGTNIARRARGS